MVKLARLLGESILEAASVVLASLVFITFATAAVAAIIVIVGYTESKQKGKQVLSWLTS